MESNLKCQNYAQVRLTILISLNCRKSRMDVGIEIHE